MLSQSDMSRDGRVRHPLAVLLASMTSISQPELKELYSVAGKVEVGASTVNATTEELGLPSATSALISLISVKETGLRGCNHSRMAITSLSIIARVSLIS